MGFLGDIFKIENYIFGWFGLVVGVVRFQESPQRGLSAHAERTGEFAILSSLAVVCMVRFLEWLNLFWGLWLYI
jgi:hypothetical protein